ncbi:hypothetical protein ACFL20_11260 [Spirochaetota bacterium]
MKRAKKENTISDLTEFTDEDGKKWVQTSIDDLFSTKELNEVLESIEKDKEKGEVILARIDFQNVNKEYYDAVSLLQERIKKQAELLKKVASQSKDAIEKKNIKLKELIEYIKKLHMLFAYLKVDVDGLDKIEIPSKVFQESLAKADEEYDSIYQEVEEKVLSLDEPKKEDENK